MYQFNKDLLLIDLEMTGTDPARHEIIQLAAVLLDKKTLKEKRSFNSYVKPGRWLTREPEAMAVNGISWQNLKDALPLKKVLTQFTKAFPSSVVMTNYGGHIDFSFLVSGYRQAKLAYPFDYHVFNIWALCYVFMAGRQALKRRKKFPGFGLTDVAKELKVAAPANLHDALADCRLEAEILRRLLKSISA